MSLIKTTTLFRKKPLNIILSILCHAKKKKKKRKKQKKKNKLESCHTISTFSVLFLTPHCRRWGNSFCSFWRWSCVHERARTWECSSSQAHSTRKADTRSMFVAGFATRVLRRMVPISVGSFTYLIFVLFLFSTSVLHLRLPVRVASHCLCEFSCLTRSCLRMQRPLLLCFPDCRCGFCSSWPTRLYLFSLFFTLWSALLLLPRWPIRDLWRAPRVPATTWSAAGMARITTTFCTRLRPRARSSCAIRKARHSSALIPRGPMCR